MMLSNFLKEANLPTPTTADYEITSKESPFSDKLILFHDTVITSYKFM